MMKTFRVTVQKSMSNRKYGIKDFTEIGNDSDEAIVHSENTTGTHRA